MDVIKPALRLSVAWVTDDYGVFEKLDVYALLHYYIQKLMKLGEWRLPTHNIIRIF